MNPQPGLITVHKADSGPNDEKPQCCNTAGSITACADFDALQDLIRQSCDAPD